MACLICGREWIWHGSEEPAAVPGSYLAETGCHDGVRMDDDEHAEGWQTDVVYPPCPHNPARCAKCGGTGARQPDDECDECGACDGTGWTAEAMAAWLYQPKAERGSRP